MTSGTQTGPSPAWGVLESKIIPSYYIHSKLTLMITVGATLDQKINKMKIHGRSILTLCRHSQSGIEPSRADEMNRRVVDAGLYLDWLAANLQMTPNIKNTTGIELVLRELIAPRSDMSGEMVNKAQTLLTNYLAQNWGAGATTIITPTAVDPFGPGGIMWGIAVERHGGRATYKLRTDINRRNPKVYGHNGITPGTWYPFRINALFWGAHGSNASGIAGHILKGAWSIVISDAYDDLDADRGHTIFYAGSNSHDNKDPHNSAPASHGTKCLQASLRTGRHIRVLRSGGASSSSSKNRHLPSCGVRYDGLYKVVSIRQKLNLGGGLYDQFKLIRTTTDDQPPLDQVKRMSPTLAQRRARARLG